MEIKQARELRVALLASSQRGTWQWWAPGDATRYRVVYVNPSVNDDAGDRSHRALIVAVGDNTLVIPYPTHELWTPERFLVAFGERYAGWWAGIRPILAAFGWTSTRRADLAYSPDDAVEIGQVLAEAT